MVDNRKIYTDDRSTDIFNRRRNGESLHAIGLTYGLTRQRVQQLIKDHGPLDIQDGHRIYNKVKASRSQYFCLECGKKCTQKQTLCLSCSVRQRQIKRQLERVNVGSVAVQMRREGRSWKHITHVVNHGLGYIYRGIDEYQKHTGEVIADVFTWEKKKRIDNPIKNCLAPP